MKREDEKKLIDELIGTAIGYGFTSFDEMTSDEQAEIVGAYILSKEIDEAWEIFTEVNERYLPHIIAHHLMKGNSALLMEQIYDALKNYVKDSIQKLIDIEVADLPQQAKDAHTDTLIQEAKEKDYVR